MRKYPGTSVIFAILLLLAPAARAQAPRAVVVEAGGGKLVSLPAPAATVFAADPKVAEVRPANPSTLFVFGLAPGRTLIAALNAAGKAVAQYRVTVLPSGFAADGAAAAASRALAGSRVHVAAAPNGLSVGGDVVTPEQAQDAMDIARAYAPLGQPIANRLRVDQPVQVSLRVRIAEMSRSLVRQLGVNWQAIGNNLGHYTVNFLTANAIGGLTAGTPTSLNVGYKGRVDVNGIIDALAQDNLVHVLAEPTLTAMSGQTASFLVGGEFPIPVGQQNNEVTVEFKQYGVSLAFVPTVLSDGRIDLRVRPEVSELTNQGAVQVPAGNASISIPALTVRRADTTVELGSGQSFAIAGLLQNTTTLGSTGIPGLGDIPILGALFRSDAFQRNETELVIVVTPYIVRPVNDPAALALPTDGWTPPNDLERILMLRQKGHAVPASLHIPGDAGFIVQ